ncbi:MAG: glycoside hydrolase domain-containing protein [Bradyrhizobium sp.]
MATAFDTTHDCSKSVTCLKQQGITTIIRYYCRPELSWKRMGQKEAMAIARAGVALAAVYQNRQNQPADFSAAKGETSGAQAYDYAENVIFQPGDSAIYFSADFDPSETVVNENIVPFFKGVQKAFKAAAADGKPLYQVGVYGSGRTCRILLEQKLVTYTWITQSTGFAEYKKFISSGKWNLKQLMPTSVCAVEGDPDEVNSDHADFGSFVLDVGALGPAGPPAPVAGTGDEFKVIATGGLRVRSGPGVEFDVGSTLPAGATVKVLSRSGDWALIDATADGNADGFVHSAFLKPI